MKRIFAALGLTLFSMTLFAQTADQPIAYRPYKTPKVPWLLERKDAQGNPLPSRPVKPIEFKTPDGKLLLFLTLPLAARDAVGVKSNDDAQLNSKNGKSRMLLTAGQGHIDGAQSVEFKLKPNRTFFAISGSCKDLELKASISGATRSGYPAILSCRSVNGVVQEVIFSTTSDAQWFGASVLETDGKGERWKSFAAKDFLSEKGVELTWGSDEYRTTIKLVPPKPSAKTSAPLILPPFAFHVGLSLLSGSANSNTSSGTLLGLVLPLQVDFQREKAWWYLTGGYDFFAYSMSKTAGIASQTNEIKLGAGGEYHTGKFRLRGQLGYVVENLQFPQIGANFSAPQLALEGAFLGTTAAYGLDVKQAQTGSAGSFSQTDIGAYYEQVLLFHRLTRIVLSDTQIKATTPSNSISASWITLGIGFQF